MIIDKSSIGKIFISYSSLDKRFVRRLAKRLKTDGYYVWIDEAELLAGDSLPKKVSEAVVSSKVVLVIVSSAAIKSKWLSFELNKATEQMVKGNCRVIPIVIEKVKLPPEVQGLLYADFTSSFKLGYQSVATALEYEAAKSMKTLHFFQKADTAVAEVFGKKSYISVGGEYSYQDYEAVSLPYKNSDGNNYDVVYESITDYLSSKDSLTDKWVEEFIISKEQFNEDMFLVVTERPVVFKCDIVSPNSERVRGKRMSKYDWDKKLTVFVDVSGLDMSQWKDHLITGRALLIEYGKSCSFFSEQEDLD